MGLDTWLNKLPEGARLRVADFISTRSGAFSENLGRWAGDKIADIDAKQQWEAIQQDRLKEWNGGRIFPTGVSYDQRDGNTVSVGESKNGYHFHVAPTSEAKRNFPSGTWSKQTFETKEQALDAGEIVTAAAGQIAELRTGWHKRDRYDDKWSTAVTIGQGKDGFYHSVSWSDATESRQGETKWAGPFRTEQIAEIAGRAAQAKILVEPFGERQEKRAAQYAASDQTKAELIYSNLNEAAKLRESYIYFAKSEPDIKTNHLDAAKGRVEEARAIRLDEERRKNVMTLSAESRAGDVARTTIGQSKDGWHIQNAGQGERWSKAYPTPAKAEAASIAAQRPSTKQERQMDQDIAKAARAKQASRYLDQMAQQGAKMNADRVELAQERAADRAVTSTEKQEIAHRRKH